MSTLVICPMRREVDLLVQACSEAGQRVESAHSGRLPLVRACSELALAHGGTGKAQFALQTQHLLDAYPQTDLVVCAGAAGGLDADLRVGDVVVATETVEHDFRSAFDKAAAPRFSAAADAVDELRGLRPFEDFGLHFGVVASGDEDIVDAARRDELHGQTGALAVAWEGAGGARACAFSGVDFLELRGVTDAADADAAVDFHTNLHRCMINIAAVIAAWKGRTTDG